MNKIFLYFQKFFSSFFIILATLFLPLKSMEAPEEEPLAVQKKHVHWGSTGREYTYNPGESSNSRPSSAIVAIQDIDAEEKSLHRLLRHIRWDFSAEENKDIYQAILNVYKNRAKCPNSNHYLSIYEFVLFALHICGVPTTAQISADKITGCLCFQEIEEFIPSALIRIPKPQDEPLIPQIFDAPLDLEPLTENYFAEYRPASPQTVSPSEPVMTIESPKKTRRCIKKILDVFCCRDCDVIDCYK